MAAAQRLGRAGIVIAAIVVGVAVNVLVYGVGAAVGATVSVHIRDWAGALHLDVT